MSSSVQTRIYERRESAVFCKTNEAFGGLSNMAPGYPLRVNDVNIRTSEALYQACRFPHLPEIQRLIIDQTSPMTAKMKGKPYRGETRSDWDSVRTRVMRWCLRVKLAQNWTNFSKLLLSTGDRPIVEESRKDDFWGAFAQDDGTLAGRNVLGRLLMELREELKKPTSEALKCVEPIPMHDFLLYGKQIERVQAWRMPAEPVADPDLSPARVAIWDSLSELPPEEATTSRPVLAATQSPSVPDTLTPGSVAASDSTENVVMIRRLIEVDLPIARISAHARREKSIRHGHISTLHIWWARRPLAACRAVVCAALWPDPADPLCPPPFRAAAARELHAFARRMFPDRITDEKQHLQTTASPASRGRWEALARHHNPLDAADSDHLNTLRHALLDFIADFANWDNSTAPAYLDAARALTRAAHEALGGEAGTRPLVADPFAGGGSIPLEALRVGADAFASDLNPVAVLLNKVVLEYIPKYGQALAAEVRKWGAWVKEQAEKELAAFYPADPDGATPIAYLWARTVTCDPALGGCGAEVPLMRSLWLAKKDKKSVALRIVPNSAAKRVEFEIVPEVAAKDVAEGTVKRGSATCPCCGFTTPVKAVREQLKARRGGAADARLYCVVTTRPGMQGRFYRLPTDRDLAAVSAAAAELDKRKGENTGSLGVVPDEVISPNELRRISVPLYGMTTWGDLFTPRQSLALSTLCQLVVEAGKRMRREHDTGLADALQTGLALCIGRVADLANSLCGWKLDVQCPTHLFARQAVPMVWDFSESVCLSESSGSWYVMAERLADVLEEIGHEWHVGTIHQASATQHPLPSDSVNALITDPPYYDAVPYAYLSDFFYVWQRRCIGNIHTEFYKTEQVPKDAEIVVDRPHELSKSKKDIAFYEMALTKAFDEGRRVVRPDGISVIVFASKTTASWEAILQAVLDGGWIITGSWPIDTEMETRVSAQGQARLASSVHLVCRPRENSDGSLRTNLVGDWRDVLSELPVRMHEWMPRLASEGVVGADAIFACLGPALEIFSRYARVEKSNGDAVALKEYLEQVWAAVSKEAISTIFRDADATGLEPDARLTAVWLWTLGNARDPAATEPDAEPADEPEDDEDEDARGKAKKGAKKGFVLEFDAARKIAQGLGIHLEQSGSVVEVKGELARLLPVTERTVYLFGKAATPAGEKLVKKKKAAPKLPGMEDAEAEPTAKVEGVEITAAPPGATVLDRLHQAMILFGAQRGELLKRFLVDDGAGQDARLWNLAQALAALYPPGTDERRWVEGVLARKKGLGL